VCLLTELFGKDIGLVCRDIGLLCRDIRLFCRDTRLFCRDIGLFCRDIGLFCRGRVEWPSLCDRYRALLQRYQALLPKYRALLQTTPGSVLTQGYMKVFSYLLLLLRSRSLQHTAIRCNTLQHSAIHCNTPQHTATHCVSTLRTSGSLLLSIWWLHRSGGLWDFAHISAQVAEVLVQHTSTHCNTLRVGTSHKRQRYS